MPRLRTFIYWIWMTVLGSAVFEAAIIAVAFAPPALVLVMHSVASLLGALGFGLMIAIPHSIFYLIRPSELSPDHVGLIPAIRSTGVGYMVGVGEWIVVGLAMAGIWAYAMPDISMLGASWLLGATAALVGAVLGLWGGGTFLFYYWRWKYKFKRLGLVGRDPLSAISWAVEHRLMRVVGRTYQFRHALIRDAFCEICPAPSLYIDGRPGPASLELID